MIKIVIVGGGSYAWGPLFLRDMMVTPALAGCTIMLHDTNPNSMDLVYRLGMKLQRAGGFDVNLERSEHLDLALSGADFVILTITTGGLEAMRHDLELPARFGIRQSVGDTVGPGGLSRGLRNIPVVTELGRRMEAICPDAWLLNYTNPMSTLTRAISRVAKIKVIGLCHEYVGVLRKLAQAWSVEPTEIESKVAGINHLPWILDLKVQGRAAMSLLHELASEILDSQGEVPGYREADSWSTIDRGMIKSRLLQLYQAFPAAGDRHLAEFFPFFLTKSTGYGRQYGIKLTSIEERYQWRSRDEARVQMLLNEQLALEPYLRSASHEAANQIVAAIVMGTTYHGIMNLPNRGQISNLPQEAIVETLGEVTADGAQGNQVGALPSAIQSVLARHISNQELIVEAALTGNRQLALQALLNDPMVSLEPDSASELLEAMLFANKPYLPQFF